MFVTTIDGLLISVDDTFGLNGPAVGVFCWAVPAYTFQRKELKEIEGKKQNKGKTARSNKGNKVKSHSDTLSSVCKREEEKLCVCVFPLTNNS